MRLATIIFSSAHELMEFISVIEARFSFVDVIQFTIKGQFIEADIELAKAGYKATVIENLAADER